MATALEDLQKIARETLNVQNMVNELETTIESLTKKLEDLMKVNDKLRDSKRAKEIEKVVRARKDETKAVKENTKELEKSEKQASKLEKRLEVINNANTEFSKRTAILSKAIAFQTLENEKGFNLGISSFRAYEKAGGNAFEYLAEFISSAREEVQIFGMEAAKLRKVMYGFLPSGTFAILNRFSSVLQFTGGIVRRMRDDAEDIDGPLKKVFGTFLKFGKLRNPFKASVRNIFPKEMPKLVEARKELLSIEKELKGLSKEERRGKKGAKLRGRQQTLKRQIPLMEKSRTQEKFNVANKVAADFAQKIGTTLRISGKAAEARKESTRLFYKIEDLEEQIRRAEKIGDEVLVNRLMKKKEKAGIERTNQQQIAEEFDVKKLKGEQKALLARFAKNQDLELLKRKDPSKLTAEETEELTEAEKRLEVIAEELGKAEFGALSKSMVEFAGFSVSNKAKAIQKGIGNFIKNIIPMMRLVFMGFLQFFIYFSLFLIAVFAIKKFFEGNGALVQDIKDRLAGAGAWFMENIYPILEEGVSLIMKAFGKNGSFADLLDGLLLIFGGIILTGLFVIFQLLKQGALLLWALFMKFIEHQRKKAGDSILKFALRLYAIFLMISAAILLIATFGWIPIVAIALGAAIIKALRFGGTRRKEKLEKKAKGGLITSDMTLVGEEGPELVSLPRGSRVQTASQTRNTLSKSQQNINNINITINAKDTSRAEMRRIAEEIGRMVNSKINRNTSSRTLG